jgi:hypothetical protein
MPGTGEIVRYDERPRFYRVFKASDRIDGQYPLNAQFLERSDVCVMTDPVRRPARVPVPLQKYRIAGRSYRYGPETRGYRPVRPPGKSLRTEKRRAAYNCKHNVKFVQGMGE